MNKPGPLCHLCPLEKAKGPVWGEGSANARLAIIGQNPGPDEVDAGRPFVGGSGRLLNKGLYTVGINREAEFVDNVVKCFVEPGKPVPPKAIECCKPLLDKAFTNLENLRVTTTLGVEAFNSLTPKKLGFGTNKKKTDHWLRGCPYRTSTESRTAIIPTYHPSAIMRAGFLDMTYFLTDLHKIKRWRDGFGKSWKETFNYSCSTKEVDEYIDLCIHRKRFGLDIETPEKVVEEEDELVGRGATPIDVVGLSAELGDCIGVSPDQFALLKRLFGSRARPIECVTFNWGFDGYHLATQFDLSGLVPVDLMLALNILFSNLRSKDLGIALSLLTDLPYHKNLARSHPDIYNARDTYGALEGFNQAERMMEALGVSKVFWEQDSPLLPIVEEWKTKGIRVDVEYAERTELQCVMQGRKYEEWWEQNIPQFSWSSPQQLATLFKAMGMPVVMKQRAKKDGTKYKSQSVDEDVLEKYRDEHDNKVAGLVLEIKRLKHAGDITHIYGPDGYCRPQFMIHRQKQGRIQAKDPNIQTLPEELAGTRPRKMILPDTDDDILLVADWSQIELWLYASQANDQPFLDAHARGDYVYGFLYEEIFNEPFFEPNMPRRKDFKLKSVPPDKLLIAKSGPLGWLYGRQNFLALGISKARSEQMAKRMNAEHPAIVDFHQRLEYHAERVGLLQNPFGRIRRFPNVKGQREELYSFPGQSTGADTLRSYALRPLREVLSDYGARTLFSVHDSVWINCPKRSLRGCALHVRDIMETPIKEVNNISIPTEIKVGPNGDDLTLLEAYGTQSA